MSVALPTLTSATTATATAQAGRTDNTDTNIHSLLESCVKALGVACAELREHRQQIQSLQEECKASRQDKEYFRKRCLDLEEATKSDADADADAGAAKVEPQSPPAFERDSKKQKRGSGVEAEAEASTQQSLPLPLPLSLPLPPVHVSLTRVVLAPAPAAAPFDAVSVHSKHRESWLRLQALVQSYWNPISVAHRELSLILCKLQSVPLPHSHIKTEPGTESESESTGHAHAQVQLQKLKRTVQCYADVKSILMHRPPTNYALSLDYLAKLELYIQTHIMPGCNNVLKFLQARLDAITQSRSLMLVPAAPAPAPTPPVVALASGCYPLAVTR